MSPIINGFIIISLLIALIYSVGLLTFISEHDDNDCDMTFMFEYPQFVRISNKIDEKYPKYGLYAYSEGRFTEQARQMVFTGIPVLFIPGNGGSHRQVRSLASIALRKAVNSHFTFHFDYFCLDLNEELSGLNGAVLFDQLEYANASIARILELYDKQRNRPKSVVLFGHSMGGIIANRIVLDSPKAEIPILLTLSSPHQRHPFLLDAFSDSFYKGNTREAESDTTVVSISGGYSDFVILPFLTKSPNKNSINVISTNIPKSWVSADHLCILWCKQTILTVNRALFDSVDPKTKQISTSSELRKRMFHHHLVQNSGVRPQLLTSYNGTTRIRNNGQWIEKMNRQYSIHLKNGVKEPHFYMIRLLDHINNEMLSLVAVNLKVEDWVFVCGAHIPRDEGRVCEEFTHLSHLSEIQPSGRYKRRFLQINLHKLLHSNPDFTHLVVRILPTDDPVTLHVDVHSLEGRQHQINLPHLLLPQKSVIFEATPEKCVNYELFFPQLTHVIQYYQLFVEAIQCNVKDPHASASLIAPWGNQKIHNYFMDASDRVFYMRLYESKPLASNLSAKVQLILDPRCQYKISIRSSIMGLLSQIARFYSPLLVVNISAVVLMTLNAQLKSLAEKKSCSLLFIAVKEGAKPYFLLTLVKLASRMLSFKPIMRYLPPPDWIAMLNEGSDFFLLPLLIYMTSVGIVWMLGIILSVSLIAFETTVHKLALKFLARTVTFNITFSDHLISILHKIPFVVVGILILLTITTSGSLALIVGAVFYFMKLTQMSQDYIEELVWFYVKRLGRRFKKRQAAPTDANVAGPSNELQPEEELKNKGDGDGMSEFAPLHNSVFFHSTLFFIWCIVALINIPSAITWAHNFKYSTTLQPDPAFTPGLILSLCALPLWQFEWPKVERKYYLELSKLISFFAIISLIYSPISIYRLNYILPGAIVCVVLHQLFATNREEVATEQIDGGDDHTAYETIKRKIE